ncbi:FAD-binding oxidoreductase [Marivita sp. XM-24bin2]|jgi:glycine/D-amino acid oxidase-like deaminating enzyme|uniref:NAD(P)/FAD-dependent oxidoreductase n=1 Tax=unclassified Marivita TaxID=2632480 RepID=UPI000D7987CC|nr:FAD-binding oxidoreductase [Marivita sp. XM-24bin2]MCR9110624.1 FAD-binding oxidoreductase [Paracoccaceae bacterium]PWL37021.1 MAG: FAD-dependent oxidoreductase [Marivita sp. XM-24bin2]
MKRIYEDAAYRTPESCWWRDTAAPVQQPQLEGDHRSEVAVIGGGFTGLNAALALAKANVDVTLIDAEQPGWGASGRNGGFCCLGGSKLSSTLLARRFGQDERSVWHKAEHAAVDHVNALLMDHAIDADRHSAGETQLAHTAKAMRDMRASAAETAASYGVTPDIIPKEELRQRGLSGRFFGGITVPIGFALNPAKYHAGLVRAVQSIGARLFGQSPALSLHHLGDHWRITTPKGTLTTKKVVLATNGYSSEDLPDWLRARYLPVQSTIIVTRPITPDEQARQGWTSLQMCYDSRILLHYFRLMPDGRFLFGMRGGLRATSGAEVTLSRKIRKDFLTLFPEWRDIEITHEWSGLACLMRRLTPFAGPVPDHPGLYAAMGYHGNGVAMGSYLGARLADIVLGRQPDGPFPDFLITPPNRFPLGSSRRMLLAPAYAAATVFDR